MGNGLGGRFGDRSVDRTLFVTLASLSALLVAFAFAFVMPYAAISAGVIFLWGVASFALVPPLQMRVMAAASGAPNLASATNIGAFNLGNAIGAAIGGAVISAGLGFPAVALAGAAASAAGGLLLFVIRAAPPRPAHLIPSGVNSRPALACLSKTVRPGPSRAGSSRSRRIQRSAKLSAWGND